MLGEESRNTGINIYATDTPLLVKVNIIWRGDLLLLHASIRLKPTTEVGGLEDLDYTKLIRQAHLPDLGAILHGETILWVAWRNGFGASTVQQMPETNRLAYCVVFRTYR